MALEVGERVGDYEIIGLIGAGGMGRVYKARNIISNREEAMKVLLPDLTSERDLAARFMMEIRTLATLDHPNIAQLRTAFQFQNQLVMIMEFVEGVTLEKLSSEMAIPTDRMVDFATQALSALSFAHTHGVIHRDIKPANIMITTHGMVKLMDFGIAKNADEMHLTRPGMTIGSVYYMSPEQVRGGTVDARSDIYSFGITLYESLTGRKPFQADTSYSVLNAQLNEAPIPPIQVNPALPAELNAIVLHALEKSPDARFQTAQEFHDALKALQVQSAAGSAAPLPMPVAVPLPAFASTAIDPGKFSPTSAGFPPAAPPPSPFQPVAAVPTAFAPVPSAQPIAQPASKSNRGLWIGLGALAAVLALVAVAVVLPRVFSTSAKQSQTYPPPTAVESSSATASTTPAATPPSAPASVNTPPASPTGGSATSAPQAQVTNPDQQSKPSAKKQGTGSGGQQRASTSDGAPPRPNYVPPVTAGAPGGGVAATPAPAAGPSPQEIREANDRLMNIESRADAARSGIQSIRSQQQAQGLDIRGDILTAQNRMNFNLRAAHTSIEMKDLTAAAEYMDRADQATSHLEKFLGR
jgi:eukaryotic-like serine/threonine-protein kinase